MSGRNKAWTDEELGHLQDLHMLTARQAGVVLGRNRKQVLHMRQRLRLGWERKLEPITESDLDFVADYSHFTAEQIARYLGRSLNSVNHMRSMLRERGELEKMNSRTTSPMHIGNRTLVAKTCTKCGLLLDASWFRSRGTKRVGHTASRCRKCAVADLGRRQKVMRYSNRFSEKLQNASLETATNSRKEWTGAEIEVLHDMTLTNFEKAIRLGRTYYGVNAAMCKLGLRERKPQLGDPTEAQWFIRLRKELQEALAVAA
jgi:hypothetical protein